MQISKLFLPTFSDSKASVFILGEPVFSNTTRLYPKISVPNNSEVPKKIIMLHRRFWGKYRHLLIIHGLFVSHIILFLFKLAYFWKVCQFRL